jgi:general secretion pathway protein G
MKNNQHGFSLMELLIVMVIIGLLASLVGPQLFGQLGGAKQKTAKAQIEMLRSVLNQYRLDMDYYPSEDQGLEALVTNPGEDEWLGPYLDKSKIPLDPWNQSYIYRNPGSDGREIDIYSLGLDKKEGGEGEDADVVSWE